MPPRSRRVRFEKRRACKNQHLIHTREHAYKLHKLNCCRRIKKRSDARQEDAVAPTTWGSYLWSPTFR